MEPKGIRTRREHRRYGEEHGGDPPVPGVRPHSNTLHDTRNFCLRWHAPARKL